MNTLLNERKEMLEQQLNSIKFRLKNLRLGYIPGDENHLVKQVSAYNCVNLIVAVTVILKMSKAELRKSFKKLISFDTSDESRARQEWIDEGERNAKLLEQDTLHGE